MQGMLRSPKLFGLQDNVAFFPRSPPRSLASRERVAVAFSTKVPLSPQNAMGCPTNPEVQLACAGNGTMYSVRNGEVRGLATAAGRSNRQSVGINSRPHLRIHAAHAPRTLVHLANAARMHSFHTDLDCPQRSTSFITILPKTGKSSARSAASSFASGLSHAGHSASCCREIASPQHLLPPSL